MDAIKRGRTFFSTGPLVRASRSRAASRATRSRSPPARRRPLRVVADVVSIAPLDSLEILVNGEVAQTVRATDPLHVTFDGPSPCRAGGWVAAARQRSEVEVSRRRLRVRADVARLRRARRAAVRSRPRTSQFLADTVDAIWARVEKSRWRSDAERDDVPRGRRSGDRRLREVGFRSVGRPLSVISS